MISASGRNARIRDFGRVLTTDRRIPSRGAPRPAGGTGTELSAGAVEQRQRRDYCARHESGLLRLGRYRGLHHGHRVRGERQWMTAPPLAGRAERRPEIACYVLCACLPWPRSPSLTGMGFRDAQAHLGRSRATTMLAVSVSGSKTSRASPEASCASTSAIFPGTTRSTAP